MTQNSSKDIIIYLSIMLVFFGCYQRHKESSTYEKKEFLGENIEILENSKLPALNEFQALTMKGDTIKVSYLADSIRIVFNNENTSIKIPYTSPTESIIPCNCIVIKNRNNYSINQNIFLFKDSFLMLPVFDVNRRINLFVIDTSTRKILPVNNPRESNMLSTYLTSFIINENNGIITTSNSLDLDGNTVVHTFQINKSELTYLKSIDAQSDLDIYSDEEKMKHFIKLIAK